MRFLNSILAYLILIDSILELNQNILNIDKSIIFNLSLKVSNKHLPVFSPNFNQYISDCNRIDIINEITVVKFQNFKSNYLNFFYLN